MEPLPLEEAAGGSGDGDQFRPGCPRLPTVTSVTEPGLGWKPVLALRGGAGEAELARDPSTRRWQGASRAHLGKPKARGFALRPHLHHASAGAAASEDPGSF